MRKAVLMVVFILLINSVISFAYAAEENEFVMPVPGAEYSGYIITVKNPDQSKGDSRLFGESVISHNMTNEELVSFVDENVNSAQALIPEIGMMTVEDEETLDYLVSAGLVESYEPDYYMYLLGYDYSENPAFGLNLQWGHSYVNSSYAWNAGIFGKDVKVAVIDSGVYPHNDLKNNLLPGKNYTSDDPTDTVDTLGHGTFVAGIIAAECNNIATVGLAHRAKIVPFKVTSQGSFLMSVAIQAMKDAVDIYDCDIINMSLGTPTPSAVLQAAVSYVTSEEAGGAILVAAAGNGIDVVVTDEQGNQTTKKDYEAYVYPASYDSVISVANAERSSSGLTIRYSSSHNDMVDIAAPGSGVYSLSRSSTGYTSNSGTSFATPYVSAAAALAKSIMPEINQAQFNMALTYTADSSYITETMDSDYWGAGLLDVEALLKFILNVQYDDFYLSSPDKQLYGNNTSVYLTNLTDNKANFGSVVLYNHLTIESGISRLNSIKFIPVVLESGKSMEISFNDLGMFGEVKYSMLSDKLKPLINPVRIVTVEQ